jgi:hypothetical protein
VRETIAVVIPGREQLAASEPESRCKLGGAPLGLAARFRVRAA